MITQYEDPGYLEAVYAALFAQLQTAQFPGGLTFVTSSRLVRVPDQIVIADQPALMLLPGPLHAEQREIFGPVKWTFTAVAVIMFQADGSATPNPLPATVVNNFVWGLQAALANTQPPYQKQTFNGLVYHCWIEGDIVPEVADQQVTIAIPIYISPGPVA